MIELQGTDKVRTVDHQVPDDVLVSILVQTYNHENYIAQCLDSLLEQETDFNYEILLSEDESSDKTREICISYAERFPEKIRLFLHSRENNIHINDRPTGRYAFFWNLNQVRGKYISWCEGDDYFLSRNKLQKQINFLENNPDYSICFHQVELQYENDPSQNKGYTNRNEDAVLNLEDLVYKNEIATSSVIHRLDDLNIPEKMLMARVSDWVFHLHFAQNGKVKYFKECMSAYRIHDGGLWQHEKGLDLKRRINIIKAKIQLRLDIADWLDKDSVQAITKERVSQLYLDLTVLQQKAGCSKNEINESIKKFKESKPSFIKYLKFVVRTTVQQIKGKEV